MPRAIFNNIHDDADGYKRLAEFFSHLKTRETESVSLEFNEWFDASMCSPLACVLAHLRDLGHEFHLGDCNPSITELLCKNHFFAEQAFSSSTTFDTWGNTIAYKSFRPSQIEDFQKYIAENFPRDRLPTMTDKLWESVTDGFLELFANAEQHAEANTIFVCGQIFPRMHRLKFTITDTGIGFKERLYRSRKMDLSAPDSIEWCMKGGNTTKKNDPGGVGLNIIKDFIKKNGGSLQVVSHSGYWRMYNYAVQKHKLKDPFPGTAINITIRTNDPNSYHLSSESAF